MQPNDRSGRGSRGGVRAWGGLIVAAVVCTGAFVFASVPHSFTANETLTAENLNGNFSALDQRVAALEAQVAALKAPLVWMNADLLNSWTAYGGAYAPVSFAKDAQGVVHMRGLAARADSSVTTTLFVLPPGYRPRFQMETGVACSGTVPCEVVIKTTGETYLEAGAMGWASFDGLTFEAAPAP